MNEKPVLRNGKLVANVHLWVLAVKKEPGGCRLSRRLAYASQGFLSGHQEAADLLVDGPIH